MSKVASKKVQKAVKAVVTRKAKPQPSKPPKKKRVVAQAPVAMQSYSTALVNATDDAAEGARVPDMYALPTTTLRSKGQLVLTSDANGSFDFVWIGRPYHACYSKGGSATVTTNPYTPYAGTSTVSAAVTMAVFNTQFSTYRVVGNGIKMRNLQAPLNATGRLIVSRLPLAKNVPGPNLLTAHSLVANLALQNICGVSQDANSLVPTAIIELPDSQEYTIDEILGREIVLNNKPISGRAFEFCSTYNKSAVSAVVANDYLGDEILATGNIFGSNDYDSQDMTNTDGWTCLLIRGLGFPVSTNIFEMDAAIHVEGIPAVSTIVGAATFVPASMRLKPTIGGLDRIMDRIQRLPVSTLVDVAMKTAVGNYSGALNSGMRALL
jgi:hypothetical protein